MRTTLRTLATGLAVLTVGTAGCGSDTPPPPQTIDVNQLDVGSYATESREIGKPGRDRARVTEGQRLAGFVPLPMDIDSQFSVQYRSAPDGLLGFVESVYSLGLSTEVFTQSAPGFVAGFYSAAYSEKDLQIAKTLENTVLLFSDQQTATSAAGALARAVAAKQGLSEPVEIGKYRDALAFWKPGTQELHSFRANGPFVIYTETTDAAKIAVETTDLPAMVTLVEKSLDTVGSRLREFTPIPPDYLASIPLDHDGMLGRSLPRPHEDGWRNPPGLYDRAGALHLSSDPAQDKKLFDDAGVDWLANNGGFLYRAKNPQGAQLIRDSHSTPDKLYRRIDPPKNLPDARCREFRPKPVLITRFHCVATYDRYAAEVWSDQLIDVRQRISAQYAILAKEK
ncbi:DUF7373 family lipoprotein [Nocardia colli]|uniref:DUF7373 family lipoprotein n=1 Tax=Nocardia colli TaxID=2545717 RepID=UPI0035D96473